MEARIADLIIETVEDKSGLIKDADGKITHYVVAAENWRRIRISLTNSVRDAAKAVEPKVPTCPCGEDHTPDEWHTLGMVCGRCNKHTGNNNQGHYWAMCQVKLKQGAGVNASMLEHHFCCPEPDGCELQVNNG